MKFRTKAADLLAAGVKIGEMTDVTVSIKGSGERIPTSDGVIKTVGQPVADVDFESLTPTTGMKFNAFRATLEQTVLAVSATFNGEVYVVEGTFDEGTMKSVVSSGKTTGSFKFSGAVTSVIPLL